MSIITQLNIPTTNLPRIVVIGAGFGGCAIALVNKDKVEAFKEAEKTNEPITDKLLKTLEL